MVSSYLLQSIYRWFKLFYSVGNCAAFKISFAYGVLQFCLSQEAPYRLVSTKSEQDSFTFCVLSLWLMDLVTRSLSILQTDSQLPSTSESWSGSWELGFQISTQTFLSGNCGTQLCSTSAASLQRVLEQRCSISALLEGCSWGKAMRWNIKPLLYVLRYKSIQSKTGSRAEFPISRIWSVRVNI